MIPRRTLFLCRCLSCIVSIQLRSAHTRLIRAGLSCAAILLSVNVAASALPQDVTQAIKIIQQQHNIPVIGISLLGGHQLIASQVMGAHADTPLRWGSNTKTVTALTLLAIAAERDIDLQQPLSRWIDPAYWQNPWRQQHPVRLIHLVELTAGFTDLSSIEFNHAAPISLTAALALAPAHRTTRWPPGLQHSYSNLVPGLSQLFIETSSGLSFAQAAHKYVFEPLGMASTNLSPRSDLPGGYRADGQTEIPYWHMTFPAYGAMNAPLADMNRLALTILNGGPAIPQPLRQRLFQPLSSAAAQRGFEFEYAAGFYPRVRRGLVWHGHGGDADGYRSRVALIPDQGAGYIAVINTDNPAALRAIERVLEHHLAAQLPTARSIPSTPLNVAEAQQWAGAYYPASVRFGIDRWQRGEATTLDLKISNDQTHLIATRDGRQTVLLPVGPRRFRRPNDPVATVALLTLDGTHYLQGELGNYAGLNHCPSYLQALIEQCENSTTSD